MKLRAPITVTLTETYTFESAQELKDFTVLLAFHAENEASMAKAKQLGLKSRQNACAAIDAALHQRFGEIMHGYELAEDLSDDETEVDEDNIEQSWEPATRRLSNSESDTESDAQSDGSDSDFEDGSSIDEPVYYDKDGFVAENTYQPIVLEEASSLGSKKSSYCSYRLFASGSQFDNSDSEECLSHEMSNLRSSQ